MIYKTLWNYSERFEGSTKLRYFKIFLKCSGYIRKFSHEQFGFYGRVRKTPAAFGEPWVNFERFERFRVTVSVGKCLRILVKPVETLVSKSCFSDTGPVYWIEDLWGLFKYHLLAPFFNYHIVRSEKHCLM